MEHACWSTGTNICTLLPLATAGLNEALVGRFAATVFAMATRSRPSCRIALAAVTIALVTQPGGLAGMLQH